MDAIKDSMKCDNIPVAGLVVRKVLIPDHPYDNLEEKDVRNVRDKTIVVRRGGKVSDYFTIALKGYLHILVESQSDTYTEPTDDTVLPLVPLRVRMSKQRQEILDHRPLTNGKLDAPSMVAKPANFAVVQKKEYYYYCPRPADKAYSIPLALLHEVFGKFSQERNTSEPTSHDYIYAETFRREMCNFYDQESARRVSFLYILQKYGIILKSASFDESDIRTDGYLDVNNRPIVILEVKNELGSGGADPSLQALIYYERLCEQGGLVADDTSYHPCFMLSLAGPRLCIGGFAYGARPV
ncbi:hypothetical protein AX15_007200, partial [Amanita polypyramis BW_CC]